jgi:hypothetical protein
LPSPPIQAATSEEGSCEKQEKKKKSAPSKEARARARRRKEKEAGASGTCAVEANKPPTGKRPDDDPDAGGAGTAADGGVTSGDLKVIVQEIKDVEPAATEVTTTKGDPRRASQEQEMRWRADESALDAFTSMADRYYTATAAHLRGPSLLMVSRTRMEEDDETAAEAASITTNSV